MKKSLKVIIVLCYALLCSCGGSIDSDESSKLGRSSEERGYTEDSGYQDGTYCAEIKYYNPNTGTSSKYTLEVEVENNELTEIYWPNGGWLDGSHFASTDISSGEASFSSDAGYEYDVRIIGKEGDCSPDTYIDVDFEKEKDAEDTEDGATAN